MNTVTDYYAATASQRGDMLAQVGHGRRRAAASPFDEIARTDKTGQPYWSARDLAKLFGYSEWRKFTDSIRKAREQVSAHNIAGQPNSGDVAGNGGEHFVNTVTVSRVGFGDRTIPDVHLTRFAAYFVALNADQSKPEVRAAVNYYFVGRTIQAEQMIQAGADDNTLTAENAKRIADLELAVQGLPEVIGDAIAKALGSTAAESVKADDTPRKRGKAGRPGLPSLTSLELASQGSSGKFSARLTRDGFLDRRTVRYRSDGAAIREYREGSHVGMFRFRKHMGGPYTASGRYVYVTEAGQRYLAEKYGWEMP